MTAMRQRSNKQHRSAGGGFVLIAVLWMLTLIALLTTALTYTARLNIRAGANLAANAEAAALADGLAWFLSHRVAQGRFELGPHGSLATDGSPVVCRLAADTVEMRVIDAAGLIDLNAAPLPLLQRLFEGLGIGVDAARAFAARVGDFRDADDVPLADGAEDAAYRAAGLEYGPKNAPFATAGELDQILGMTPALYARLRSLVTVHSGSPGLSPAAIPAELDAVLVPQQGPTDPPGGSQRSGVDVLNQFFLPSPRRAFVIRIRVGQSRGGSFEREAVIQPTQQATLGFLLREWTSPPASDVPQLPPAVSAPLCFGDAF